MMTLTLTPELVQALQEEAERRGTTPELLALDSLRRDFLPAATPLPAEGTMADFLGDFIGCLHSSEVVPGGARMSEATGRKFTEILLRKRQSGKL